MSCGNRGIFLLTDIIPANHELRRLRPWLCGIRWLESRSFLDRNTLCFCYSEKLQNNLEHNLTSYWDI